MIRYLGRDEYGTCLPLWREAFPEDSNGFLEYYFEKRLSGSRVLVKEDEAGRILTMAHLNPYRVMVGGRRYELPYIVGVATAADSRRQGHMRDVLVKMLLDMNRDGTPFCYLMPASPDIYRPFGFTHVFDQPVWRLKDGGPGQEKKELRLDGPCAADLAWWMNGWLEKRYQVYALRDKEYLRLLQAELDSEGGHVWGWMDSQGKLGALQAFWGIHKQEQRFLYSEKEEWVQPAGPGTPKPPGIMARITYLPAMAEAISLREDCPCLQMEVPVRVRDGIVAGNDGLWGWHITRGGSSLIPVQGFGMGGSKDTVHVDRDCICAAALDPGEGGSVLTSTEVLDVTISQMASWLLGYCPLDRILEADGIKPPFWWGYIKPLEGIFLDEIV